MSTLTREELLLIDKSLEENAHFTCCYMSTLTEKQESDNLYYYNNHGKINPEKNSCFMKKRLSYLCL